MSTLLSIYISIQQSNFISRGGQFHKLARALAIRQCFTTAFMGLDTGPIQQAVMSGIVILI
jgi:hypothetical protein